MTKRLLDIDDAALEDATRILETPTMDDTVNEAWIDLMASADFGDLRDSGVIRGSL